MILINVRYRPKPEYLETFRDEMEEFTTACRNEPGCVFFQWYRNTDDPEEYILIEGYADDAAGKAHVESDHFQAGIAAMEKTLRATPKIIYVDMEVRTDWDVMGEIDIQES